MTYFEQVPNAQGPNRLPSNPCQLLDFSDVLLSDGKEYAGAGVGNGPIDAAVKALINVEKGFRDMSLEKFNMKAITGGTNAVADVTVSMRRNGRYVTASSVNGDTVMASVEAILKGMNRLMETDEK